MIPEIAKPIDVDFENAALLQYFMNIDIGVQLSQKLINRESVLGKLGHELIESMKRKRSIQSKEINIGLQKY